MKWHISSNLCKSHQLLLQVQILFDGLDHKIRASALDGLLRIGGDADVFLKKKIDR